MQRIATVQQTPAGWSATQYFYADTLYWPVRERVTVCDSRGRAYAVAAGWAEDQDLAVVSEAAFGDLLLREVG
jgi:hypothetical protein